MKTMKLALGCCGGLLAVALLGGRAEAQATRFVRGDLRVGAGGGVSPAKELSNTWHPIIYDHAMPAPGTSPRRLLIYANGTVKLVDGTAANPNPLAIDHLDAATMASLREAIAAASAYQVVRVGGMARTKSVSTGPAPAGPNDAGSAAVLLRTRLDAIGAVLARNVSVIR